MSDENKFADPDAVCIAVDWGTTRFRAHLLTAGGHILSSVHSDDGMSSVVGGAFEAVLLRMCLPWIERHPAIPILMAGMVGSRNGWHEVPYINCPGNIRDIACGMLSFEIGQGTRVQIMPGLMTKDEASVDVMRGEETQILGAMASDAVVVQPGTHSKWVIVRDGRIETFRTFMTGEFYHLLAERSVLRLLAQVSQDEIAQIAAFRRGVMASTEKGGILNLAFQARAGVLADTLKPTDVELYLSGLLIGEEILNGRRLLPQNLPLVLVAGGRMAALYNEAFTILGSAVMTVDPERAFVDGLLRIVSHQKGVRNVRGR